MRKFKDFLRPYKDAYDVFCARSKRYLEKQMKKFRAKKALKVGFYNCWKHRNVVVRVYEKLEEKCEVFWIPERTSAEKDKSTIPADAYVTSCSGDWEYNAFKLWKTFYIPHGLSPHELRNIWAHKVHLYKAVLLSGSWYKEQILKGVWGINPKLFRDEQLRVVGWSKLDTLFDPCKNEVMKELKQKLKMKLPYRKTVLYSPTGLYEGISSFYGSIDPILDFFKRNEFNLIVKCHFRTYRKSVKEKFLRAKNKALKMPNVTWIEFSDMGDITPLYWFADVLVSDASSTLWEFLATDKPSIELINRAEVIMKPEPWRGITFPGGVIKSGLEELPKKLVRAIDYPDELADERRVWRRKILYKCDGLATERACKVILEMIE